uniref:Protein kinase n=1 Tax=Candidatus Desulfatibia profunda TaxID=2841695 RepID=A0A8J6NTS8_9BACT|nr:protein kinase [Candidatus Desulfatibia profunda]
MSNSPANIFQIGNVLNHKWVIIEFIGKGAMGEVYRAHQLNLKRDVAIKVISEEMIQSFEDDPDEIETAFQRFRREVQAMAQIRHPNVLQIFDYGSDVIEKGDKDIPVEYIVMEYIPGATLRFTMPEEGFYPEHDLVAVWLVDYFLPLLEGVAAIHSQDIVHRDLKPENVLLDGKTPKIADFGLACSHRMKPLTQSIAVMGTPAYMSPEHFFDFKNADRQSDIYSLGKILFEAVSGKLGRETLPFKMVGLQKPESLFFQNIDRIIQDATVEKKEQRLNSIVEFRQRLLEALELLKSETATKITLPVGRLSFLHKPIFIWAGIIFAVTSMALMGLWHLMRKPGQTKKHSEVTRITQDDFPRSTLSEPSKAESISPVSPNQSILGKDGKKMLFIPGGDLKSMTELLKGQGKADRVQSFYMDEDMVTNHHFAEFLNEAKDNLVVENGVVKHNSEIWFYIGEGIESHEQIIYKHGRFHLRNTEYAAHQVVRVTWYGASAYARHYGKRLVTEYEWDYVMMNLAEDVKGETGTGKIGMGEDIKEWIQRSDKNQENRDEAMGKENLFYDSLVAGKSPSTKSELKQFRYPWEAFPDVGFRCAQSL